MSVKVEHKLFEGSRQARQCDIEENYSAILYRDSLIVKYQEDDGSCGVVLCGRQYLDCHLPSLLYWQVVLTVTPPFSHLAQYHQLSLENCPAKKY